MAAIKIGFIGYKGHATRLIKIFDKMGGCNITHFFHPNKDINISDLPLCNRSKSLSTRNLEDLYSCDGIVISSPNYTHFAYLKKLAAEYKGYIFCEKPPVSSIKELKKLEHFPDNAKGRIYFNFNMRLGFLSEVLSTFPERYKLGDPVRFSITVGHGLGFKKAYKDSWRAKKSFHAGGILETLGIHYLDLVSFLFGKPKDVWYNAENLSPYGNSKDTCHLSCRFNNRCVLNLTCSYCIPFAKERQFYYTNGLIDFSGGSIKVFAPRDTFGKDGRFAHPPLVYKRRLNEENLFTDSLKDSCRYFMGFIKKRQAVGLKHFRQSIDSNRMCLR